MADTTGISWTDRTHNEWWGCSSTAGPGCERCYAALFDRRVGGNHFGIGTSPRLTKEQNRDKPYKWNREAEASGKRVRVFCGSMMDFFDKNAPEGARRELWGKIKNTSMLDWQVLTKRTPNIPRMLPQDWGEGYDNVWLGATCEDRKSGLRRLEQLRVIPAKLRFLSIEPLLEDLGDVNFTGIHWVIIGGESTSGARKMEQTWVENIIAQCREQRIPVFFKQWGGNARDKGGCLINGIEIKEWPKAA
ncbi:MAG: DUF5131 family protein [Candidatus Thiodiazotropha endolucinida]